MTGVAVRKTTTTTTPKIPIVPHESHVVIPRPPRGPEDEASPTKGLRWKGGTIPKSIAIDMINPVEKGVTTVAQGNISASGSHGGNLFEVLHSLQPIFEACI